MPIPERFVPNLHIVINIISTSMIYRKTAVKLPPFKVEDVRLKNE